MRILLFSVAHPGARTWCHALPWWALHCGYPHEPPAAKQKYSDYDYAFPPKGSNLRKGPCRARDGVGLLFVNFNGLYCLAVNVAIASLAQHRNYLRITVIPDDVILVAVTIHKTEAHVIISRL